MKVSRLGVLTSGGDAPGMNTAIRAVVRTAVAGEIEVLGVEEGFDGLIRGATRELTARDVGDILQRGGTFLQTARSPEMMTEHGRELAVRQMRKHDMDALIVIGGDGSMAGARALHDAGVRTIGIPASIDNDIGRTETSIGVDSALNTICDAVDRLRDTASSHQRVFLIETMGRNSGYLALMAGIACGAELAVIPEVDLALDEIATAVRNAYRRGKTHAFIMVAEGAKLGIGEVAAHLDASAAGFEPRITLLGHVQRGGPPSAFDRLIATRFGVAAVDAVTSGESGMMTALRSGVVELTDLADIAGDRDHLDAYELIRTLAR